MAQSPASSFPARSVVVRLPARHTRVTPEAVQAVLDQLGPGEISVRVVRDALGGGSLRDVAAALKLARGSIGGRARAALERGEPAATVLAQAISQFEAAATRTNRQLDARVSKLTGEISDLMDVARAQLARTRSAPTTVPGTPAPSTPAAAPVVDLSELMERLAAIETTLKRRNAEVPAALSNLEAGVSAIAGALAAATQREVDEITITAQVEKLVASQSSALARFAARTAKTLAALQEQLLVVAGQTKPKVVTRRRTKAAKPAKTPSLRRPLKRSTKKRTTTPRRGASKTARKAVATTRTRSSKKVASRRRAAAKAKPPVRKARSAPAKKKPVPVRPKKRAAARPLNKRKRSRRMR